MGGFIPVQSNVFTPTQNLITHYALIRSDGVTSYACPWLSILPDESNPLVLNCVFNYTANYGSAEFLDSAQTIENSYRTLDIRTQPMISDFLGFTGTFDTIVSTGTIDSTSKNIHFKIQFSGTVFESIDEVSSPQLGKIDTVTYPENEGTVASVSTDTVRLTVLADAGNFSPGDLCFFSSEESPDSGGATYEVDTVDAVSGAVTFTTSVASAANPGDGIFVGIHSVVLDTGNISSFPNGSLVHFSEDLFPAEDLITYEVLSSSGVTLVFSNLPVGLTSADYLFIGNNRIAVGDASLFSVDEYISIVEGSDYVTPSASSTVQVLSVDTDLNILTLSSYPEDIDEGYSIFSGSIQWSMLRYSTTS